MSENDPTVKDPGRRAFLSLGWLRSSWSQPDDRVVHPSETETVVLYASKCLAWQNTICMSCRSVCPEEAIVFDQRNRPTIDHDLCTDCGLCIEPCPPGAIVAAKRL